MNWHIRNSWLGELYDKTRAFRSSKGYYKDILMSSHLLVSQYPLSL
jgi:hypothetical protein